MKDMNMDSKLNSIDLDIEAMKKRNKKLINRHLKKGEVSKSLEDSSRSKWNKVRKAVMFADME